MRFRSIGVIGAGVIGVGVATDLLIHGLHAVLVDVSDDVLQRAKNEVLAQVRVAPMLGKHLPRVTREQAAQQLTLTTDIHHVSSCDFIIENVTEDWKTKQAVYGTLDDVMPPEVCFGANTSCFSITHIGSVTRRPGNIVGVHFMNPVHLISAVEVIRGFHTTDETLSALAGLLSQLQKEAIVVEDSPGFVSNRISHLFMNEAAFVLQESLASPEKIDKIFKKCFGHKMGPLETADLIGLDTVMRSLDVLYESFHDPKYRCCPLLRKLVHAGHLGRKTGRGFYSYMPDANAKGNVAANAQGASA